MLRAKSQVFAKRVATSPRWLVSMASVVRSTKASLTSSQLAARKVNATGSVQEDDAAWVQLDKLLATTKKRLPAGCSWDILDDEEKGILVANKLVYNATLHLTDRDRLEGYGISAGAAAILKHVFPDTDRTATVDIAGSSDESAALEDKAEQKQKKKVELETLRAIAEDNGLDMEQVINRNRQQLAIYLADCAETNLQLYAQLQQNMHLESLAKVFAKRQAKAELEELQKLCEERGLEWKSKNRSHLLKMLASKE